MNIRTFSSAITAALLAVTIIGCQNNESSKPAVQNSPGSTSIAQDVGVTVPTQEQADADAAKEITADNADQAFEDLQKEVDTGG